MKLDKILLPTDFSATANKALYHAASLAELYNASITLLHVLEDRRGPLSLEHYPELLAKATQTTETELENYAREHAYEGVPFDTWVIHSHVVPDVIIEQAETHDMIVMGSHGHRTLRKRFLGSTSQALLHETPCPLLNVRGDQDPSPKKILAPIDFSDANKPALKYALSIAEKTGAELTLLHVVESLFVPGLYIPMNNPTITFSPEFEDSLLKEMKTMVAGSEVAENTQFQVLNGNAAELILDYAERNEMDLVILASHGLTAIERFLIGSVADRIVRSAKCPVLLLPTFSDR